MIRLTPNTDTLISDIRIPIIKMSCQTENERKNQKDLSVKNLVDEFKGYSTIEIDTLVNRAKSKIIDNDLIKDQLIHKLQDEVIFLQQLDDNTTMEEYHYELKGDISESRSY